ncbi:hypothetical protein KL86SPO_70387 [uncultured Sporomusa sp.]|uniref:Uncharacterized protein n=1 Tax=uncultured Sporomusa sp. TaxID=307249 RepID=A0A212M1I9_9FIRM|nr:hypothetical protein KL86SPO_70387 [uncultured Sporomusa sp.]
MCPEKISHTCYSAFILGEKPLAEFFQLPASEARATVIQSASIVALYDGHPRRVLYSRYAKQQLLNR